VSTARPGKKGGEAREDADRSSSASSMPGRGNGHSSVRGSAAMTGSSRLQRRGQGGGKKSIRPSFLRRKSKARPEQDEEEDEEEAGHEISEAASASPMESIESARSSEKVRADARASENESRRVSVIEAPKQVLMDGAPPLSEQLQLKKLGTKEDDEKDDEEEVVIRPLEGFDLLTEVLAGGKGIREAFLQFLPTRQVVELSMLSKHYLHLVNGTALRLDKKKKVADTRVLDQVFNPYYQDKRMSKWTLGGLFSGISDLTTLFRSIEPSHLRFIGLVNPELSSIMGIRRCKSLERFELHGNAKDIDIAPLLELKDTLEGVSLLACSKLVDISLVSQLNNLRIFSIFRSLGVKRLPDFSGCTKIELLSVGECLQIEDLSPISSLMNLTVLDVTTVKCFSNLDFLRNCKALRVLIMDRCDNLKDISGLEYCGENLEVLRMNKSIGVTSLNGVQHCKRLISLEITYLTGLQDIESLRDNEKLIDLCMFNCSQVKSLDPLRSCIQTLKRLIVSECEGLTSEDDAAIVNQCEGLVVFDCKGCGPIFLVTLMRSKTPRILAAAEALLPGIKQEDYREHVYPHMMETISKAEDEDDVIAMLWVMQICGKNNLLLNVMASLDDTQWLLEAIMEPESSTPGIESSKGILEVLRTLTILCDSALNAKHVVEMDGAVEFLTEFVQLPDDGQLNIKEEELISAAARVLVAILETPSGTQYSTVDVARKMTRDGNLVQNSVDAIAAPSTLDETRHVLLLLLKDLLKPVPSVAPQIHSLGLVPSMSKIMEVGSNTTRLFGMTLLATVFESLGSEAQEAASEFFNGEKVWKLISMALKGPEDVRRATIKVLTFVPPELFLDMVKEPSLFKTVLKARYIQTARRMQQPAFFVSPRADEALILEVTAVLSKFSKYEEAVRELIFEEDPNAKGKPRFTQGGSILSRDQEDEELHPYRMTAETLCEQVVRPVFAGELRNRVRDARTAANFARASDPFRETMIYLFHEQELHSLFMFVTQAASSFDKEAPLELLDVFLDNPKTGAVLTSPERDASVCKKFCDSLSSMILSSAVEPKLAASVVAKLLKSPSRDTISKSVLEAVTASLDKRKQSLHHLVYKVFKSKKKEHSGSAESIVLDSDDRRKVASMEFMVCLLVDLEVTYALHGFKARNRVRNLFASLNHPHQRICDLAAILLAACVESLTKEDETQVGEIHSQIGQKIVEVFAANSEFGTRFIINVVLNGEGAAPGAGIRLLHRICLVDSGIAHVALRAALPGKGSIASARTLESEELVMEDEEDDGNNEGSAKSDHAAEQEQEERNDTPVDEKNEDEAGHVEEKEKPESNETMVETKEDTEGAQVADVRTVHAPSWITDDKAWIKEDPDEEEVKFPFRRRPEIKPEKRSKAKPVPKVKPKRREKKKKKSKKVEASEPQGRSSIVTGWSLEDARALGYRENLDYGHRELGDHDIFLLGAVTQHILAGTDDPTLNDADIGDAVDLIFILDLSVRLDANDVSPFVCPIINSLEDESTEGRALENAVLFVKHLAKNWSGGSTIGSLMQDSNTFNMVVKVYCRDGPSQKCRENCVAAIAELIFSDFGGAEDVKESEEFLVRLIDDLKRESEPMLEKVLRMFDAAFRNDGARILAAPLVDHGVMEILESWRGYLMKLSDEDKVTSLRPEKLHIGTVLLKPALAAAEEDEDIRQALDRMNLVELIFDFYMKAESAQVREECARVLVDLDRQLLDDNSDAFKASVEGQESMKERFLREEDIKDEQLTAFPVVFTRIRGIPDTFTFEDPFRIKVHDWTTMAIARFVDKSEVKLKHLKLYYEIEILEKMSADTVFGWISPRFEQGMLKGFSEMGVADDPHSWGIRVSQGAWTPNDILGLAADLKKHKVIYMKNGRSFREDEIPPDIDCLFPAMTSSSLEAFFNFGCRPFRFSAPGRGFQSIYKAVSVVKPLIAEEDEEDDDEEVVIAIE